MFEVDERSKGCAVKKKVFIIVAINSLPDELQTRNLFSQMEFRGARWSVIRRELFEESKQRLRAISRERPKPFANFPQQSGNFFILTFALGINAAVGRR